MKMIYWITITHSFPKHFSVHYTPWSYSCWILLSRYFLKHYSHPMFFCSRIHLILHIYITLIPSDLVSIIYMCSHLCLLFPSLLDFSCQHPFLCSTSPLLHPAAASSSCLCPFVGVFLFHLMMTIIRTLVRTLFFPLDTPPNSSVFLSHLNILAEVIHDHFSWCKGSLPFPGSFR